MDVHHSHALAVKQAFRVRDLLQRDEALACHRASESRAFHGLPQAKQAGDDFGDVRRERKLVDAPLHGGVRDALCLLDEWAGEHVEAIHVAAQEGVEGAVHMAEDRRRNVIEPSVQVPAHQGLLLFGDAQLGKFRVVHLEGRRPDEPGPIRGISPAGRLRCGAAESAVATGAPFPCAHSPTRRIFAPDGAQTQDARQRAGLVVRAIARRRGRRGVRGRGRRHRRRGLCIDHFEAAVRGLVHLFGRVRT
mmetsp:Transcript_88723/g.255896  ORF Transcript_88723/g.255896 Transcript_88723/m.255896 type:complete len:248 (-) Transcript_88723:200-943(-)